MDCYSTTKPAEEMYKVAYDYHIEYINRSIDIASRRAQYSAKIEFSYSNNTDGHVLKLSNHYKSFGYHVTTIPLSKDDNDNTIKLKIEWLAPSSHASTTNHGYPPRVDYAHNSDDSDLAMKSTNDGPLAIDVDNLDTDSDLESIMKNT